MTNAIREKLNLENSATAIYKQIANILRQQILDGEYEPGYKLPSEAAMSKDLGINHITLRKSLALLAQQNLICQRQGKGTFVSYNAGDSPIRIGIIINDADTSIISDMYTLSMLAALNAATAKRQNCELILINCHASDPAEVMKKIQQARCNALIVLATEHNVARILCNDIFNATPMVFINSPFPEIAAANRHEVRLAGGAINQAVDYLMKSGYKRIAYVSADIHGDPTLMQRNKEFMDAKISGKTVLIAPQSREYWFDSARNSVKKACLSHNPPDAILCAGLSFASGAWIGVIECGVQMPGGVGFIGFDANAQNNPYMSSIEQPFEDMAEQAVALMYSLQREGKHLKQRVYEFHARIIERGSVQPIKQEECNFAKEQISTDA